MIEAYKYLAFSYVAYDNNEKAKQYFIEILKIDPTFDLDRDMTSPKILAVFDQARIDFKKLQKEEKKKQKANNKKDEAILSGPEEYSPSAKKPEQKQTVAKKGKKTKKSYNFGSADELYGSNPEKKERVKNKKEEKTKQIVVAKTTKTPTVKKYIAPKGSTKYRKQPTKFNAAWRSFILPGWGQLYKGQTTKGIIFITTTSILDLFYVLNSSAVKDAEKDYNTYKTVSADFETEYWNKYNKTYNRYLTFSLLHFLFWTYNMADATFLGWKKMKFSMDINKKGTLMFTLEKRF